MVFTIAALIAVLIYFHFYKLTRDAINPFGVSLSIYLAMYGLSTLNLSVYQYGMILYSHILLIIPVVTIFLIGECYCYRYRTILKNYDEIPEVTENYKLMMWIICAISLASVAFLIASRNVVLSLNLKQLATLNSRKGTITEQIYSGAGIIGKMAQLFPYTSVFIMYDFIFASNNSKFKKILELSYCMLCGVYTLFVLASRGTLLLPLLAILYLLNKKYKFKPWAIGVILLIVVLAFTAYMTLRVSISSDVFSGTSVTNRTFNSIYNYFALAFNNFDMLIRNGTPMTGIGYSMISLSKLLGIYNPQDLVQFKTSFFNSKVFIYGFYHDLGLFGVLFWPIIIYLFIGKIYISSRHRHPEMILLLSMYGKAMFVLSFGNYFFQSISDEFQYYICALLLLFGYKFSRIVVTRIIFIFGGRRRTRIRIMKR